VREALETEDQVEERVFWWLEDRTFVLFSQRERLIFLGVSVVIVLA